MSIILNGSLPLNGPTETAPVPNFGSKRLTSLQSGGGTSGTFTLERQEHSNWCWVSITQAIEKLFNPNFPDKQCDVAGTVLGRNCCGFFRLKPCNIPYRLQDSLKHNNFNRFKSVFAGNISGINIQVLLDEIQNGQPICMVIEWTSQSMRPPDRHYVVIQEYHQTANDWVLIIADPDDTSHLQGHPLSTLLNGGYYSTGSKHIVNGKWTHTILVHG